MSGPIFGPKQRPLLPAPTFGQGLVLVFALVCLALSWGHLDAWTSCPQPADVCDAVCAHQKVDGIAPWCEPITCSCALPDPPPQPAILHWPATQQKPLGPTASKQR
ncbi:MAG: hypothetical protein JST92_07840 [Deltaproteobacteria bacterium]|nr:hypothetical protein [Deltaproteobacteria bacterium]